MRMIAVFNFWQRALAATSHKTFLLPFGRGQSHFGGAFFASRFPDASFFWVRFLAAANDAFLARAERSSGVIVSRLRLPPILPPLLPISRMISENRAFVFLSTLSS
jgi:hypothetical protein